MYCLTSNLSLQQLRTGIDEFGSRNYELTDEAVFGELPAGIDLQTYKKGIELRATFLSDDVIDLGERRLELIATPVHTIDSFCFLDSENHLLFTGDTYYPGDVYAFTEQSDLRAYKQSLLQLAKCCKENQIDTLFCTHNEIEHDVSILQKLADTMGEILDGKIKQDYIDDRGYKHYAHSDKHDIIVS